MTCICDDIKKWEDFKKCRKAFNELCYRFLKLRKPPRESFNRWLFDIYSMTDLKKINTKLSENQLTYHPLFPIFLDLKEIKHDEIHRNTFTERLKKNHVSSYLFWELIDEVPKPLTLPKLYSCQSVLKPMATTETTADNIQKNITMQGKDLDHVAVLQDIKNSLNVSQTPMKTENITRHTYSNIQTNQLPKQPPMISSTNTIDTDFFSRKRQRHNTPVSCDNHCRVILSSRQPNGLSQEHYELLRSAALAIQSYESLPCSHKTYKANQALRCMIYGIESENDEDKLFAFKWADSILTFLSTVKDSNQSDLKDNHLNDDGLHAASHPCIQSLVEKGYLRHFSQLQVLHNEMDQQLRGSNSKVFHDKSNNQEVSSTTIPSLVSLLYSLKLLKRRVAMDYFGMAALKVCCHLERRFLKYSNYDSNISHTCGTEEMWNCCTKKNPLELDIILTKGLNDAMCENLCCLYLERKNNCILSSLNSNDIYRQYINPQVVPFVLDNELNNPSNHNIKAIISVWSVKTESTWRFLYIKIHFDVILCLWVKYCFWLKHFNEKNLNNNKEKDLFFKRLIQLMLRYDALMGNGKEGRGHQASIPPNLWTALYNKLHVSAECFASPFNSTMNTYFSLFPDTDYFFGSQGSFFNSENELLSGSYQINPPFVEPVLLRMSQKIISWLTLSDQLNQDKQTRESIIDSLQTSVPSHMCQLNKESGPLSFVVFVPNWDNGGGCPFLDLLLNATNYLVATIVVAPFEHQYTSYNKMTTIQWLDQEPLSADYHHLNQTGNHQDDTVKVLETHCESFYSVSSSFLIILQNQAGKSKWPIDQTFLEHLKYQWKNHH